MPVCEVCDQNKKQGYRRNPRTGHYCPTRFWCDQCFEQVAARASRERWENAETTEATFEPTSAVERHDYNRKRQRAADEARRRMGDKPPDAAG